MSEAWLLATRILQSYRGERKNNSTSDNMVNAQLAQGLKHKSAEVEINE